MTDSRWTQAEMAARLVRHADLRPCLNAFIDTRTPGSETKENFTIIGPGVSENPEQHVHIPEAHGFNIGGARQPPGAVNSQHSHDTAEVFVVHSGDWSFNLGEHGDDHRLALRPGDVISLPTGMFRGFTNVGHGTGFLWAVLGGDDPGRVTWAPQVFEMAKDYGLILIEDGSLIDTVRGQTLSAGKCPMPPTSASQVAALRRLSASEADSIAASARDFAAAPLGPLTGAGVREEAVIGPANPAEPIGAGKLGWAHGFHLRRLAFAAGASVPRHRRLEPEVLFMCEGALEVGWDGGALTMGEGDTLTIPVGLARTFTALARATVFAVRGGDAPSPPAWG